MSSFGERGNMKLRATGMLCRESEECLLNELHASASTTQSWLELLLPGDRIGSTEVPLAALTEFPFRETNVSELT